MEITNGMKNLSDDLFRLFYGGNHPDFLQLYNIVEQFGKTTEYYMDYNQVVFVATNVYRRLN